MPLAYKVVVREKNKLVSIYATAVSGKQKIYAIDGEPQIVDQGFVFATPALALSFGLSSEQVWECEYDERIPFPKIWWSFGGYLAEPKDAKNPEVLEYIAQIEETLQPYKFLDGVDYAQVDLSWEKDAEVGIWHVSNIKLTRKIS